MKYIASRFNKKAKGNVWHPVLDLLIAGVQTPFFVWCAHIHGNLFATLASYVIVFAFAYVMLLVLDMFVFSD